MKNLILTIYLLLAGIVMFFVGVYIAILPIVYFSDMSMLSVEPSINLISDLRGMGGLLLVLGVYIFALAIFESKRQTGLKLALFIYSTFVVFRSLGFILEGSPSATIMSAFAIELFFALSGVVLHKFWSVQSVSDQTPASLDRDVVASHQ